MLWQRTAPPSTRATAGALPDSDTLRQRALRASWERDRQVARRRIWLRWVRWCLLRYLLPVLGLLALAATLYMQTPWSATSWPGASSAPPTAVDGPDPMAMPAGPLPAASEPEAVPAAPEPFDDAVPLALRLESRWQAALQTAAPAASSPPLSPDTGSGNLNLQPENWLHSKEP